MERFSFFVNQNLFLEHHIYTAGKEMKNDVIKVDILRQKLGGLGIC